MTAPAYDLTEDPRPRLGVIVLQVDETIEDDFRRLFSPEAVRLSISRIPSGAELNPETIRDMETTLPAAAGLLPPAARFDAVAYACTSGATLIGAERVRALVQSACLASEVTNPLTATLAATGALDVTRVGIVSPYIAPVASQMKRAFEAAGVIVPKMLSFGEEIEANVARIDPASLAAAAREVARQPDVEAVFLSCTNLRTLDILADLEAELGVPVLSSNQTLAWHLAQVSGRDLRVTGPGRLLAL